MDAYGHQMQQFYGRKMPTFFEGLYQNVNRQALAPFFRSWFRGKGRVLDAGSGNGHLAEEMGIRNACFLDITWEQVKEIRQKGVPGNCIRANVAMLPYKNNVFDEVISSNVLHYTGIKGLVELLRVTRPGGQLLLSFLERSEFTSFTCRQAVFCGLFPLFMEDVKFIDITAVTKMNIKIKDSATVLYLPPFFKTHRGAARMGLVAYILEKR